MAGPRVQKSAKQPKTVEKTVKLRKHHAKPYRKRHIASLALLITALIALVIIVVQYRDQLVSGLASSRSFVAGLFDQDKSYDMTVTSSYGYSLAFDQKSFYASAIDANTGDLHLGSELNQERAYQVVRLAPQWTAEENEGTSAMTVTFHRGALIGTDTRESVALADGGIERDNLERQTTETVRLGGQEFEKTTWQSRPQGEFGAAFRAHFVTYAGMVKGNLITIALTLGFDETRTKLYQPVLESLSFDGPASAVQPTGAALAKATASRSLLDVITNTGIASAASEGATPSSEKIAALYSPAVAKVYHGYCMDITLNGQPFARNACSGGSGSGFFVSQDGYLATNGHVAKMDAKDVAIQVALNYAASKNDTRYIYALLNQTRLRPADIAGMTPQETVAAMADAIYALPDSVIRATNNVDNLMVVLTDTEPDVKAFWEATMKRQSYGSDSEAITAELVASDYRAADGYDGFRASDVAILKVDGLNYPVVSLAGIDSITQGSDISIIGYPGKASSNGLVEQSAAQATLTSGKVSSIKDVSNSDKKVIETDTTIGHGNSGGPVFNADGGVVGIATYTVDGSGEGNGVYNYVRDIKDLVDLARSNSVLFDTNSQTQQVWAKGIEDFYTSRYSRALKSFEEVKTLYPNHARVDEFVAAAEKRIANGEDVVDFPVLPVVIVAAVVLLVAAGTVIVVIVRHKKRHAIYKAGIEQGTVQPAAAGTPPQTVTVTPGQPVVQPQQPVAQPPAPTPTPPPAQTPPSDTSWFGPGGTPPNTPAS